MGPWFIRDAKNPFRPGCSLATLERMAALGRLTPASIVRGPTTEQFWRLARDTPGVAPLVGRCDACGAEVARGAGSCGACGRLFERVDDRDRLGLRYPDQASAEAAEARIKRETQAAAGDDVSRRAAMDSTGPAQSETPGQADASGGGVAGRQAGGADGSGGTVAPRPAATETGVATMVDAAPSAGEAPTDTGRLPDASGRRPSAASRAAVWALAGLNGVAAAVALLLIYLISQLP